MDLHAKITYSGNVVDIVLNWTLLCIIFLCDIIIIVFKSETKVVGINRLHIRPCFALFLGILLQVLFWISMDVDGISIIWCVSLGSYLFSSQIAWIIQKQQNKLCTWITFMNIGVLTFSGCSISYYATTLPIITTIAHFCGVILGFGVTYGVNHIINRYSQHHEKEEDNVNVHL